MSQTHEEAGEQTTRGVAGWLFSARGELAGAILAGVLLLVGWAGAAAGFTELRPLTWVSLGIGMVYGGRAALASLRAKAFDIDVLMVVAAGLAAYVNAPAEGALLLFLFTLAGALEDLAMARTRRAVEALHRLMPTAAMRQRADGEWESVPPEALRPGDVVRVLPGESIPADAAITDGRSAVDQATLTGESFPRVVAEGDEVFAGTINVGSAFLASVVRPAAQSSLQRIMNLVLEAQQQREPVQQVLDRLSQPYAIGVMVLSTLTLLVWWLGFGEPLLGENGRVGALYTAITLLIVMSPCAVIIATPTATLAAISRAARAGVLFKGGQAIERLAGLRAVALDKTGTLTVGRPVVSEVVRFGWSGGDEMLAVAAGLEQESTHPIAAAIREEAKRRSVEPEAAASRTSFRPGAGVSGVFRGSEARLGTYEHAEPLIPAAFREQVRSAMQAAQGRGDIAVVLAWNQMAGVVVMADQIRPGAPGLVDGLHGQGVRPIVMLTGDNKATARTVAERLGIDRWQAQMLPEDKVAAVKLLHAELHDGHAGGPDRPARVPLFAASAGVGVIGDGVNDAPALSAADVSIAIGSIGSDAALESADIVLLGDDLAVIPWAVALSRRARRTIMVNLVFALTAIAVMAMVTLVGSRTGFTMPLWAGVLGHEGGTMLVVSNSLLLLFYGSARGKSEVVGALRVKRGASARTAGALHRTAATAEQLQPAEPTS